MIESNLTSCVPPFAQAFLNQYCGELVSLCEAYLSRIILHEKGAENLNEELMVRTLYFSCFSSKIELSLIDQGQDNDKDTCVELLFTVWKVL